MSNSTTSPTPTTATRTSRTQIRQVNWSRVGLTTAMGAILAGIAVFISGNSNQAELSFMEWSTLVPLWMLLAGVAVVSFLIGAGWSSGRKRSG